MARKAPDLEGYRIVPRGWDDGYTVRRRKAASWAPTGWVGVSVVVALALVVLVDAPAMYYLVLAFAALLCAVLVAILVGAICLAIGNREER